MAEDIVERRGYHHVVYGLVWVEEGAQREG